ncbi:MAG: gamma-glutamyl-gamma-aminobutyrate hydrolase family protein, partial [Pirellulales bacterium]|nr:gamma-glutamyl-gamma-aminobutyrate hydrolase family protein [Pirellulales bacterium]
MDALTRRNFLNRTSLGLGAVATASLLAGKPQQAGAVEGSRGPHFAPRAKRVIYLHMSGGPSHLETFDNKPQMRPHHGQDLPKSVIGKQRLTTMTRGQAKLLVAANQETWGRFGESGQEMNVAFGGTLHPEIRELPGRMNHRAPRLENGDMHPDPEVVFADRHEVNFVAGGFFSKLYGVDKIHVNSLHGQGIEEVGRRVVAEGVAED